MILYDKYCVNGKFDNYALESMLEDLSIHKDIIQEIIIRKNTSTLTNEFLEKIKKIDEKENITNIILEFFLLADRMKPISCDKETLSKLTGLSKRQIDEKRRARQIPFIQLTGKNGSGRKCIIYDPKEVKMKLYEMKVQTI